MAIERFFLSPEEACKYLEGMDPDSDAVGKYPFRLVFFARKEGNTFDAFMTDQSWPDMGQAERGRYPKISDKEGFFGIVNAEEDLQPHQFVFTAGSLQGVSVCEDDGKLFMSQVGSPLRMPLIGIFPLPTCGCHCGKKYLQSRTLTVNHANWSGGTANTNTEVRKLFAGANLGSFAEVVLIISCTKSTLSGGAIPSSRNDSWTFRSHLVLGVMSPQMTEDCRFAAPPVFTHPKCPGQAMGEVYLAAYPVHSGQHLTDFLPLGPISVINWRLFNTLGTPVIGDKIGDFCISSNRITYPSISDSNLGNGYNIGAQFDFPDQVTAADFPQSTPEPTCTPDDFEDWDIVANTVLSDPQDVGYLPCTQPCNCNPPPSFWVARC